MQTAVHPQISPGTRVLLTGAAGFIGWHLRRRLSAFDLELHATSRRDRAAPCRRTDLVAGRTSPTLPLQAAFSLP